MNENVSDDCVDNDDKVAVSFEYLWREMEFGIPTVLHVDEVR